MLKLNTIFEIDFETNEKGSTTYDLYLVGDDMPIFSKEYGSAWTSTEESLKHYGNHLIYLWCAEQDLTLMYAVGIRYKGHVEIKWWWEIEPRDTTAQFVQQLARPELDGVDLFEFLIPSRSMTDNTLASLIACKVYADFLKPLTEQG